MLVTAVLHSLLVPGMSPSNLARFLGTKVACTALLGSASMFGDSSRSRVHRVPYTECLSPDGCFGVDVMVL